MEITVYSKYRIWLTLITYVQRDHPWNAQWLIAEKISHGSSYAG